MPRCGPRGSVRHDARTYRLMSLDRVSLNPLAGARHHEMLLDLAWEIGGADLVWQRGVYYLHVTQSREAPDEHVLDGGLLGVDPGIVNLATDSEGDTCSGASVKQARARYHPGRQRLQKVNTKNSKCRLRKNAGRERRLPAGVMRTTAVAAEYNRAKPCNLAEKHCSNHATQRLDEAHDSRPASSIDELRRQLNRAIAANFA